MAWYLDPPPGMPPAWILVADDQPHIVEAMQRGACDFIQKPWDNHRLLSIVRTQRDLGRASRRTAALEAEQRRDLDLAAQIQQHLLPRGCPPFTTLECCACWRPAGVVGGDYFDFIGIDDQLTATAIGDVSGKGVAAALLMSGLQALLRSRATACGHQVGPLLVETNSRLHGTIPSNKFATLFYGVYSDAARSLAYVNAGHNPPLLLRADNQVERLDTGGPVLGLFADVAFTIGRVELRPGDRLLLYTDGITEARNDSGEEFGESRLIAAASAARGGVAATERAILSSHRSFMGSSQPADDMTLLIGGCR